MLSAGPLCPAWYCYGTILYVLDGVGLAGFRSRAFFLFVSYTILYFSSFDVSVVWGLGPRLECSHSLPALHG